MALAAVPMHGRIDARLPQAGLPATKGVTPWRDAVSDAVSATPSHPSRVEGRLGPRLPLPAPCSLLLAWPLARGGQHPMQCTARPLGASQRMRMGALTLYQSGSNCMQCADTGGLPKMMSSGLEKRLQSRLARLHACGTHAAAPSALCGAGQQLWHTHMQPPWQGSEGGNATGPSCPHAHGGQFIWH